MSRSRKASRKRARLEEDKDEEDEEDGEDKGDKEGEDDEAGDPPQDTDSSEKILKWKQLGGAGDDKMGKSGEPAKKKKKKKKSRTYGLEDEDRVGSGGREDGMKKGILRKSASKGGGVSSGPSPKRVRFSVQGLPAEASSDTTEENEFSDLIDPDLDLDIDFDHDFDAEGELDRDEIPSGSDTETPDSDGYTGKIWSLPCLNAHAFIQGSA